ncbi:MAG: hypothetical protein ABEH56_08515 [Salinirussus sp.]
MPERSGAPDGEQEDATEEGRAMEELLRSAGVVEETPDGEDLQLTAAFEEAWYGRIERMSDRDRAVRWLAALHGASPAEVSVDDGEPFVVDVPGAPTRQWPSEAAFTAAIVVEPTLAEWIPESEWEELPEDRRHELSARLLLFLERCPSCGTDLAVSETVADGTVEVSLDCPDCGTTVFAGSY